MDTCVIIWRELCGTYPESSRGLVLVRLFVVFTFRCCRSWRNVVDDRIEGRSLGEAEVWGSRSCGAFVRRNSGSEGYDDPGGHQFVVHGLYRRCTVLRMTLDMLIEVRDSENVTRQIRDTVAGCHRTDATYA